MGGVSGEWLRGSGYVEMSGANPNVTPGSAGGEAVLSSGESGPGWGRRGAGRGEVGIAEGGAWGAGGRPASARPWLGGTTPRDSAAAPINRDGARSGVVAIRRRQLQSLVVLARWGHQSETRPGRPAGTARTGFLRVRVSEDGGSQCGLLSLWLSFARAAGWCLWGLSAR